MVRSERRHRLRFVLGLAALLPMAAHAADDEANLPPYKMLRSLQFVQDSVVLGDHSAAEMQRFMLTTIDQRLRTVDPQIFEDDRNIDAALIYAMSGGNPTTLEFLAAHDINGYFDNRVTDILRKYLSGKGLLIAKTLTATATEYRDKKIGPYLALISGNVMIASDPMGALKFYDWARLTAPGTIVEEAALRRSIAISLDKGLVDKGLYYCSLYTRRFVHSPYASQFADLFVKLVVEHNSEIKPDDVVSILDFMDDARRREVYLRIARAATIVGKNDLARLAAEKAQALSGDQDNAFGSLASFYGSVADIPTAEVGEASKVISSLPEGELSPRDKALRAAAKAVADAVLQAPDPKSLAQAADPNLPVQINAAEQNASSGPSGSGTPPVPAEAGGTQTANAAPAAAPGEQDASASFNTFMKTSQSKLDEIDSLLKQESN